MLKIVVIFLEMKIYGRPNIKGIGEACPILLNFLVITCAHTELATVKRILPLF